LTPLSLLEAIIRRSPFKRLLEDEALFDRTLASIIVEGIKDPKMKKWFSELNPKQVIGIVNFGVPGYKEKLVAALKQEVEKLDAEIDELQKVIEQEMALAELKYENKRLQRQRAALALSALGQGLQNAGRAMYPSQDLQNQQFYQQQMLNNQREILRQMQMQEKRRHLMPIR